MAPVAPAEELAVGVGESSVAGGATRTLPTVG